VEYIYTEAPSRVLLGYPGIIDTLDALGVSQTAIGSTLASSAPETIAGRDSLVENSDDYTPSREFLIGAQPDLYLSNDEQQLTGDGAATKADLAGIPANFYVLGNYCVDTKASSTIDGVYTDIENLGAIFGVSERAEALIAGLRTRVDAAAALSEMDPSLSVAVVTIFDGTVYALSGANYATIPAELGMTSIFGETTSNFSEISAEVVLTASPDVILVTYSEGSDTDAVSSASLVFASSDAVKNGRVFALPEHAFSSGGIQIVDLIEQTARSVYGE
jgi:iron complex transport system substrate-binding protein